MQMHLILTTLNVVIILVTLNLNEDYSRGQVALLRAHAGEHLLLGLARRSMNLNNILLLGNDMIIPRDIRQWSGVWMTEPQDTVVRDIGVRVMNELVSPFKAIQMDDTEFACLKAIVFFDPHARGLRDIERIKGLR